MNKLDSIRLCAVALAGLAAAACTPSYEYLDFSPQTTPPLAASFTQSQVTIPEGIAVGVAPVAMNEGEAITSDTVSISSTDTSVLGVEPVSGASQGQSSQGNSPQPTFVIFGVSPGSAGITVVVDGQEQQVIPATVTKQP